MSCRYKTLTYDVLSSVHKMEESLKRLKRARDRGGQGGSETSSGLSDDDKIRIQICLDVEYYGNQVRKFVWYSICQLLRLSASSLFVRISNKY